MVRRCGECRHAKPTCDELFCAENPAAGGKERITFGGGEACAAFSPARADVGTWEALDAVHGYAEDVWRAVSALYYSDNSGAFGKLHSGMAAMYVLAYEAGYVAGRCGT